MGRVIDAVIRLTDNFTKPAKASIDSMTSMSKSAVRVGRDIEKTGKQISAAGTTLTAAVTVPVLGLGTACLKMASDFEDGIAKVTTIADTTKTGVAEIKKETLGLSKELGIAVTDISEAQYQAISAGAATEKSLSVVRTAALSAKAGFTDTATAIDGLTSVYNSYQGAVDYGNIADQMMMTQNYGKTTFGELASSMGQVTPLANSLNVSTEELFSSIAVLTKNGIATSQAVTGMKAAYSNILKPTKDAQEEAERLGIEFDAAHLKSVGWAKFLEEIQEKTEGDSQSLSKLFGSVEALNSITVLAGAGFEDFNTALDKMSNSAGLTEQAYQKMLTPAEKWNISLNKIKVAGIQVGEKLIPVFEKVADIAGKAADKFSSLSDEQLESILKIAAMAAAAGPAISIFGKFVSMFGGAVQTVNKFAMSVKAAGGIIALAASPVGIVIAIIAALIAVVVIVIKNIDKFKAGISALSPAFGKVQTGISGIITKLSPLINLVKAVGNVFSQVFQIGIVAAVTGTIGALTGFLTGITDIINGTINVLNGIITFLTGIFSGNWELAWEGVKQIFSGIFQSITGIAKSVINTVSGAINGVIGAINGAGFTVPDWVPVIGGKDFRINIPTIPMLAKGTDHWKGGPAMVHERGGEIIDLPRGSRVYPHDRSVRMAKNEGKEIVIRIEKFADKIYVREDKDIDKIAEELLEKFKKARLNM